MSNRKTFKKTLFQNAQNVCVALSTHLITTVGVTAVTVRLSLAATLLHGESAVASGGVGTSVPSSNKNTTRLKLRVSYGER